MRFKLKWSKTADGQFLEYWSKAPDSHDLRSDLVGKFITRADITADRENFELEFESREFKSREIVEKGGLMVPMTELLFELTIAFDAEKQEFVVVNFDPLV